MYIIKRRFAEKPKQSKHLIIINLKIMNKLKLFSLFITLALIGVLVTSCEKDNLINDSVTSTESGTFEVKESNTDINEVSLRMCTPSAMDEAYLHNLLYNFLAVTIINFENNPTAYVRKADVINNYNYIADHLNTRLCLGWNVGSINWWDNQPEAFFFPSDPCYRYVANRLLSLQHGIERYLDDQNCVRKESLRTKFIEFALNLDDCFGDSFDIDFGELACNEYSEILEIDPNCDYDPHYKCE